MMDRMGGTTRRGAMAVLACGLSAGLLALPAVPAFAQSRNAAPATPALPAAPPAVTPPAAAATPDAPERTTAQFADWAMQCLARAPGSPPATPPATDEKLCEILQAVQDQRQQPVSVLAIGRAGRGQPMRLVARLPVNAMVATPARIVFEGNEAAISLPFRHCVVNPMGCYAELPLRDEVLLRRLKARSPDQNAKLEWTDPGGNTVAVPVSFRGFGAALEALQKEIG